MSVEWRGVCTSCGAELTRLSKHEDRPESFEEPCSGMGHEPCPGTVVMNRLPAFE